jgi:hypothetical protein
LQAIAGRFALAGDAFAPKKRPPRKGALKAVSGLADQGGDLAVRVAGAEILFLRAPAARVLLLDLMSDSGISPHKEVKI